MSLVPYEIVFKIKTPGWKRAQKTITSWHTLFSNAIMYTVCNFVFCEVRLQFIRPDE
jgi:hypothetical protein